MDSVAAVCNNHTKIPSYCVVFESGVIRTVFRKHRSRFDDLSDGRFADNISGTSRCKSVRDKLMYEITKIDLRLFLVFSENVQ